MIKVALIVGSTRPNRFADIPAKWVLDAAQAKEGLDVELLDLRDFGLPLFEEPAPPTFTKGAYSNPAAEAWRHKIGEFDAFIVTVAEYNHGPTAVMKNAFDSAFYEWNRKPIGFVGYGGVGGARAIEHLRGVAIELQMAPLRAEVNIARAPFVGVLMEGKSLDDYDYLVNSRNVLLDEIVWWGEALKAARQKSA